MSKQLTKREIIAAMCLQGLLANSAYYERIKDKKYDINAMYSLEAIDHADNLLKHLEETKK